MMIYLFIDENQIKLLYLKKTILGQQETYFFEKRHETKLIDKNISINSDLSASAIKEALTLISPTPITEHDICLILPQSAFYFIRTTVPSDIAPSAITSFIKDKARTILQENTDDYYSDYFTQENNNQKVLTYYSISKSLIENYKEVLVLVDLKIHKVIPDTLAYFKLFDKTLRKEKKENIFYVTYDNDKLTGYLYDSYGLISPNIWRKQLFEELTIEKALKDKALDYESNGIKLNRIILSGSQSENIRQDTFTKAVGVWTNPLKRIIPNFYQDYLKILVINQDKKLPILRYDECFGAFIFNQENKGFVLLKSGLSLGRPKLSLSLPNILMSRREIILFLASFTCSFLFFLLIFKNNINLNFLSNITKPSPTVTPTPVPSTPTPTLSIDKKTLKISVLNGSGTPGKANDLKIILKDKGYQELLTDNADNFDYSKTIIQTKKNNLINSSVIVNDLKDYVNATIKNTLDDKNAADVVIIIGKDFK